MRKHALAFTLLLAAFSVCSQSTPKEISAVRTTQSIKIDGDVSDEAWRSAPRILGLTEQRPSFGNPEDQKTRSELYLLYDDDAIYFGGVLREANRDSVSKELSGRDAIGVNDFIGIVFDTYRDQINGLGFYVTPLGEQFDVKYSLGYEDAAWNAVYHSEAKLTDDGWSFEMRIPYSAIRFSKEEVQNWGMNIVRRRTKSGKQFTWNPVDPTKFGFMNQAGQWTGLTDIKPPVRLSFSPYFSTYLTNNPQSPGNDWKASVNGGMDVKYGLSKSFTLDMTLVPDFGQVQSDNLVLNLTPFEVRYNEYRSFFTEGTELFNKGNLFYSRRIGGTPLHYYDVPFMINNGDRILKNPSETKLINATKISGRTPKGLGVGFFNAITRAQHAEIEDVTKQSYEIETSPLTNYNVVVLDQTMKNNSSVTLVNTNVWRSGGDYDANVTAVLWDLYDNKVNWNVWGQVTHSRLMDYEAQGKTTPGFHYNVYGGKFKGRFNFEVHRFYADKDYNQRDMGYFTNSNYLDHGFWGWYKWLKPKGIYNNLYLNMRGTHSQLAEKIGDYSRFQYVNLNSNINGQLKNLWGFRINADVKSNYQDFYEPRVPNRMVKMPATWMAGLSFSTNQSKKYSAGLEFYKQSSSRYNTSGIDLFVENNYRFSDKFSLGIGSFTGFSNRNFGFAFVANNADSILFGLRKRRTVENTLNAKYNFNNKMGLTFRLRHYWSKVEYTRFFNLEQDGNVSDVASVNQDPNNNVNFFNIDMNYTWQFAPGSFLNLTWKTATQAFDQYINREYYHNLRNTLSDPQQNTFSVKVIYYLDYLALKGKG